MWITICTVCESEGSPQDGDPPLRATCPHCHEVALVEIVGNDPPEFDDYGRLISRRT